jgi:RNA polymerase sigma factor (TIGR02999 family)
MRRVLVDCARAKNAKKRGGNVYRVEFETQIPASDTWAEEVIDIDSALTRLAKVDERQARIVEMRFFAGLTELEIGRLLGISDRTVKRDWECARAWLYSELNQRRCTQSTNTTTAKG